MAWFRVHGVNLQPIAEEQEEQKDEIGIKTRDVKLYVATYETAIHGHYLLGRTYIHGEVITKTNARDAFMKGVEALMSEKDFDPAHRYEVSVCEKTVKEPLA